MTKAFDITLGVIADLDETINLLKTDMTISDSHKIKDLQKIVSLLESASSLTIDAVIELGKYEGLL